MLQLYIHVADLPMLTSPSLHLQLEGLPRQTSKTTFPLTPIVTSVKYCCVNCIPDIYTSWDSTSTLHNYTPCAKALGNYYTIVYYDMYFIYYSRSKVNITLQGNINWHTLLLGTELTYDYIIIIISTIVMYHTIQYNILSSL